MNPFVYGTVVSGKHFFDRKEETSRIVKTLSGGNNMVLYAPRRFGKTSLIYKAMAELEKKGHICVYFDFMPVYSADSFVRAYSKALADKQNNLSNFAKTFSTLIKGLRPVISFNKEGLPEFSVNFESKNIDETAISSLLDITETLSAKGKRTLVFFDEFQEVVKLKGLKFEALLRSKTQRQSKTNYLFFGSKTHLISDMFNNKKRAFYNAAMQMSIGALPENETIEYLQRNLAKNKLADNLAKYLIEKAGAIPHYIQMLAGEIWQCCIGNKSVITKNIIDDCAAKIVELKSDYYMELFDRQSQSKKQLLWAISKNGKNIFSIAYQNEFRLPGAATVQRAAKELLLDGIIEKLKEEYFVADPFFKMFIESKSK